MPDSRLSARFSRLEIPAERRRADWSFLEAGLQLPSPLPLEEHPLLLLVNGRALVPAENEPGGGPGLLLHGPWHALEETATPAKLETRYREAPTGEVERSVRRFVATVPVALLDDPARLAEAVELLEQAGPARGGPLPDADRALPQRDVADLAPRDDGSLFTRELVGHARLLRLHGKLYDLVTLHEYVRVFEKALEPELLRTLATLPATAAPAELLGLLEANLGAIHPRARSPLRNKLGTCRALVNGVTLLPLYREEAVNLFATYRQLLERDLKLAALGGLAARGAR
jgi:hypothetical protein